MIHALSKMMHVLSGIFLPLSILLAVGMVWYYVKFVYKEPVPDDAPSDIRAQMLSDLNLAILSDPHVIFDYTDTVVLRKIPIDSGMLVGRTTTFMEAILSSGEITGAELKEISRLMTHLVRFATYDTDFLHQQKNLAEAVSAGAVETGAVYEVDTAMLADNLTFRNEKVIPFFMASLSTIHERLSDFYRYVNNAIKASGFLNSLAKHYPNWEKIALDAEEKQKLSLLQLTEAWQLMEALYGSTNEFAGQSSVDAVRAVLDEVKICSQESAASLVKTHHEISEILPDFPKEVFAFNVGKRVLTNLETWLAVARAYHRAASTTEAIFRQQVNAATDSQRATYEPTLNALTEINNALNQKIMSLRSQMKSGQALQFANRPNAMAPLLSIIHHASLLNKRVIQQQFFIENALLQYENGNRILPTVPTEIRFESFADKPALIGIRLFDQMTSKEILGAKITVLKNPDIQVTLRKNNPVYYFQLQRPASYVFEVRAPGHFPRRVTAEINPALRKNYTLTVQLRETPIPQIENFEFLSSNITPETRAQMETQMVNDLIKRYDTIPSITRILSQMLSSRLHLIANGFEPGPFILPKEVQDMISNSQDKDTTPRGGL